MDKVNIPVKKMNTEAILPTRNTSSDAGWDLYAYDYKQILPKESVLIPVGVAMAIPIGWVGLIKDRSSMAYKRQLEGAAGVIDAGYRGEIMVMLRNVSNETKWVNPGDRVGQMLILPVPDVQMIETDNLEETERGTKGFGSSGK